MRQAPTGDKRTIRQREPGDTQHVSTEDSRNISPRSQYTPKGRRKLNNGAIPDRRLAGFVLRTRVKARRDQGAHRAQMPAA